MLLIVEDRIAFHLLPGADSRQRSTELALRRMGWLDVPPQAAPAAPIRPSTVAASAPGADTGTH